MGVGWLDVFAAGLAGGVTVKLIEIVYGFFLSRDIRKRTATEVVGAHLDPLLKAADEIVGKTRSLADRDFKKLIKASVSKDVDNNILSTEILGLLYLYAQFWGRIEILRRESMGISISADKRGALLNDFISCLESPRIRLVDRTHQKAIGELAISSVENESLKMIGIVNFDSIVCSESNARDWFVPALNLLENVKKKHIRQRVLVYGAVMHALIDTLDPQHHTTHDRPSYPNKLNKESRRDIKYRVFSQYLKRVKNVEKYVGKN